MKINLEFEQHDLVQMISQYFLHAGFEVQNMEEICAQFTKAFPGGLLVRATIAQGEEETAPSAAQEMQESAMVPAPETATTVMPSDFHGLGEVDGDITRQISNLMGTTTITEVVVSTDGPALSFNDLMDPTRNDVADMQRLYQINQQLLRQGPRR